MKSVKLSLDHCLLVGSAASVYIVLLPLLFDNNLLPMGSGTTLTNTVIVGIPKIVNNDMFDCAALTVLALKRQLESQAQDVENANK